MTRRTAGSRFVPPVKQDNEDYTDRRSKFDETVRSRVMTHGGGSNSSGGGGSNLPPELEGNERLRNIEPKMVELIINEVIFWKFEQSKYCLNAVDILKVITPQNFVPKYVIIKRGYIKA